MTPRNAAPPRSTESIGDLRIAAAAIALSVIGSIVLVAAPAARAERDWALNGTFVATSNGDWAATNDVYRDEVSVRSLWTISMTCSNTVTCEGRVDSDAGWSAPIATKSSEYVVERVIPDWERCADGTATVTGHQRYRFFPVGEGGFVRPGSPIFAGSDKTSGESGACRLSDKLEIDMPFRLEKQG